MPKIIQSDATRAKTPSRGADRGRVMLENSNFINWADELLNLILRGSDAASRMRVSLPIPLGDYKCINDRLPLFFDTVTNGTADVSYNSTLKSHNMQTSADGDWAIVETYQPHNYFAGKGHFVEITSFDFDDEPNVEKRLGYYKASTVSPHTANADGFYLYSDGTEHRLKIVNNGTDILDIPQSEWDDPLDGFGDSGFRIEWDKFNVFQFSFLWLGGTGLQFNIVVGQEIYRVHTYTHVGSENSDKLIFASPNQYVRYEIRQTGAGSGTFQPVCATVMTEGSESSGNVGIVRSIDTGASDLISASAGTEYLVKGIRLKASQRDAVIDIANIDAFAETINDYFRWRLHLNPTITGGTPSWSDVANSAVQEANGDGVLAVSAEGEVLASGYGSGTQALSAALATSRKLGVSINGTLDEVWLTLEPIEGSLNLNVFGEITYKEFV